MIYLTFAGNLHLLGVFYSPFLHFNESYSPDFRGVYVRDNLRDRRCGANRLLFDKSEFDGMLTKADSINWNFK